VLELWVVLDVRVIGEDGVAWHHLTHLTIRRRTGKCIADTGVPAGTWTVNVRCLPPASVTRTTHVSADAVGAKTMACSAKTAPKVKTAPGSFRRLMSSARRETMRSELSTMSCGSGHSLSASRELAWPTAGR
jgi:hypothetical protein